MQKIYHHQFKNGLSLVAEPVAGAESLAMSLLLPSGVIYEPADQVGVATMLAEMICRGAGDLDARAHSDALDQLGIQRGTNVESIHLRIEATMIGSKVAQALPLLLNMALCPSLDQTALEPSRDLSLQTIEALDDEPQQKVFIKLREQHYPQPYGRPTIGDYDVIKKLTRMQIVDYWKRTFVPKGAILSFAGNFDWATLKTQVAKLTANWSGQIDEPNLQAPPIRQYVHESSDSTQVHIGLIYDTINETHPNCMLQRAAAAVLSGGMSGRLFTEVREKRGLCYSVFATYAANRQMGVMIGYAGTTAARAQETLDVFNHELQRLAQGITKSEFQRAIVGMKSRIVMQGESTAARASAIAFDQYTFGQPRTLEELSQAVDLITFDDLNQYLSENKPSPMSVRTIGPDALNWPTS